MSGLVGTESRGRGECCPRLAPQGRTRTWGTGHQVWCVTVSSSENALVRRIFELPRETLFSFLLEAPLQAFAAQIGLKHRCQKCLQRFLGTERRAEVLPEQIRHRLLIGSKESGRRRADLVFVGRPSLASTHLDCFQTEETPKQHRPRNVSLRSALHVVETRTDSRFGRLSAIRGQQRSIPQVSTAELVPARD